MRYALLTISLFFAFLPQSAGATVYYVDFSAATGGNGLTSGAAYNSLDSFTEVARTAGDIAFVRRGVATTTNISDITFNSSGTVSSPIIISADYDNIWGDFATSAETWIVQPGLSYIRSSASSTSAFPGKWIYFEGDCYENAVTTLPTKCELAYEIEQASSTGILLYLPYRGSKSGAATNMRVMPRNPQWNVESGDFQWNFDTDHFWLVQGMDIRGTDAQGQIELDTVDMGEIRDSILTGNGASDVGVRLNAVTGSGNGTVYYIRKTRIFNNAIGVRSGAATAKNNSIFNISDSIIDGNAVASSVGVDSTSAGNAVYARFFITNSFFRRHATYDFKNQGNGNSSYLRNVRFDSATEIGTETSYYTTNYYEDYDGVVGRNQQNSLGFGTNTNTAVASSTTLLLRAGGGPVSIQVQPTTNSTSTWEIARLKLFEYPINADTSSKQYDVYFMSPSDTWNNNPTNSELWIECEYWSHVGSATSTRAITKSTGTVDFNGSTSWQSLSVTCQPTQSGLLYLRGWYGKTKESGTNRFYVDGRPVIQ